MNLFVYKTWFLGTCLTIILTLSFFAPKAQAIGLVPCGNGNYSPDVSQGQTQSPNTGAGEQMCTVDDLFKIVVVVTNFLIGFAGLIAVLMIARAGLNMVTSAGNQSSYTAAKKSMAHAILGMLLVLLAFVLVNTLINGPLKIFEGGGNIFKNAKDFIKGK